MSSLAHRLILADSGWDCGFHCNIFLMNHTPFLFASDVIKWNMYISFLLLPTLRNSWWELTPFSYGTWGK